MPKELSKTLGKFRTGIFQELTEKYHSLLSRGETVYNLYVGTPDLLPDRRVTAAVAAAAADPENYKYSIVELPALKKALIDYYTKRYGASKRADTGKLLVLFFSAVKLLWPDKTTNNQKRNYE